MCMFSERWAERVFKLFTQYTENSPYQNIYFLTDSFILNTFRTLNCLTSTREGVRTIKPLPVRRLGFKTLYPE